MRTFIDYNDPVYAKGRRIVITISTQENPDKRYLWNRV